MTCPKCNDTLSVVYFGTDIEVKRCNNCAGIFARREMLQRIRDEWLVESIIDVGANSRHSVSVEPGTDVICPACGAVMDPVRDDQQKHIVIDVCSSCDSVFLDPGELTDMKTVTLIDHIRKLLGKFS
ncbi:zf-TFIIB domain-containing protein [Seongchinamella unica]|uniref:zf-TFIIB domain-containing protein n=1 Tax=Seongchinamella unica TaxID=2547392 RepID=UPI001EED54EB|nr:zf-TFIIB domain-containing protein [Seongchinamella unica]